MKKILYVLKLSLILISFNTYADKIAVINLKEIFQKIAINKNIPQKLELEFKDVTNELENMEIDLQNWVKKLQQKPTKPNEKDLKIFEEKRNIFLSKAEQFKQNNQNRQLEERDKILQLIKIATKKIAGHKYDLVIDVNAVFYKTNKINLINISDLVIQKVKENK